MTRYVRACCQNPPAKELPVKNHLKGSQHFYLTHRKRNHSKPKSRGKKNSDLICCFGIVFVFVRQQPAKFQTSANTHQSKAAFGAVGFVVSVLRVKCADPTPSGRSRASFGLDSPSKSNGFKFLRLIGKCRKIASFKRPE